ncbi:glycosyltransferase [Halomonas sp. R1t8]|uniref:glycosyltransferase n=1 Tax=unclassified Halomonas TaxID=2609666 RepID=UPI00209F6993|nr:MULTISPECIES: glycosyltransferase [unclassified Halomonas]MCP1305485.1 glycosyltransferase [Halomonas sp. R1t8]MCP1331971.1 glycosyltransferase [Halomonas sp. R1t4]
MSRKTPALESSKRKPRLLWANPFCLLDTSSGASMTVRQMLHQLVAKGYEVQVLGATVFDNPKGMGKLKEQYSDIHANLHQLIKAEDGPLTHQLLVTYSTNRNHLTTHESSLWYSQYTNLLDHFKPDVVWFYGGQTLDMLIPDEARDRGIPTAFYLANGSYKATRWCRDIDLVLTDSQATADMYRKAAGFAAKPIGKFIDQATFVAEHHERKRLLYINPSWAKGASIVVQLALQLERKRPDIEIEVVEARADWAEVLRETSKKLGQKRDTLPNVIITPNTSDMREPYGRARVLLAPSLWWESSGRVLAEAMLNGIPALITNRGGMPEMVDDAGIAFDFPEECHEEPYQHLLSDDELQPLLNAVIAFYDDEALYQSYVERAKHVGEQKHHLDKATQRLVNAFTPLVRQRAGNKEFTVSQRKRHRQNLASVAGKPEFKVDTSFLKMVQSKSNNAKIPTRQSAVPDFDWQISGKVIVLDNRAKLIKSGAADKLAALGAFGIVSFDPASEVDDPKQYEGSETIQVFQHALLGDGKPSTLYTCLAPEMSSTLAPLPEAQQPEHRRQGAKVLTKLPINTIALDSIEGLGSLDWLILDDLSDAMAILENGEKALKETLIIQVRIAFQPTHKRQPNLAEVQHWMSRHGFRFYRFNNEQHRSHLPESVPEEQRQATELTSADAVFLPSQERMVTLSDEQKLKLAFVLNTVFEAKDMAYELLNEVDLALGEKYLVAQGLVAPKSQVPPPASPAIPQSEHVKGEPVVSVVCATYNHVNFIEDAIKGFIAQKTDFPFEVIIHDDASTDGTQEVIKRYAEQYPELIRPIYQTENQYSQNKKPLDICLPLTKGRYVAICEGDDYWTDSNKLQIQFDYMEQHPDCVVTHHNAFVFDSGALVRESKLPEHCIRSFTSDELLKNDCFVLTLSMMFRKKFDKFPKEKGNVGNGDNFLISMLGLYGDSTYLEDPESVRPAPGSTSNPLTCMAI